MKILRKRSEANVRKRRQWFMDAAKGLKAHDVVAVFNRLTWGRISWRGCSKGHIADEWAGGVHLKVVAIPQSTILLAFANKRDELAQKTRRV